MLWGIRAGVLPIPFARPFLDFANPVGVLCKAGDCERRSWLMAQAAPYGRSTQKAPSIAEINVLWITAGLSCDGDSVSVTAAMQPSVEDVLLGAIPGLPKVHLHNPVLAYECGDDFMKYFY